MGIFGGYSKKDFLKNSALFNDKLMEIRELAAMNRVDDGNGLGNVINVIMANLGRAEFPSDADGKNLKSIDLRIFDLMERMKDDVQRKSPARLSAHATMVLNAVSDVRRFGKEAYTAEEIKAQEAVAECKALIRDALLSKGKKQEAQKKLEEKSSKMSDGDANLELMAQDWEDIENEISTLNKQIETYRARHNANVKIMNMRGLGKTFAEMPERIATVAELDRESNKILEKLAEESAYVNDAEETVSAVDSAFGEAYKNTSAKQSDFYSKRAAKQMEQMANSVDEAAAQPSEFSAKNPFAAKMRRD